MMIKLLLLSLILVEPSGYGHIDSVNAAMDGAIAESVIITIPSSDDHTPEEQFVSLDHADATSVHATSSSAQSAGMP